MTRTIEVVVSPSGQAEVTTKGFAGSSCRQASDFLEKALGERQGEQLTAEFHQQPQNQSLTLDERSRL